MTEAPPSLPLVLSRTANNDIADTLRWSNKRFGREASRRYEALLTQALLDIERDPSRLGVSERPELPSGVWLYHLYWSRERVTGPSVKQPRHFIAFRPTESQIEVLRILHDARDLPSHLADTP